MHYKRSDDIKDLAAALVKVQSVIKNATKGQENTHFKSTYADLADCWDVCRKPLSDNGLLVIQTPFFENGLVGADTILMHTSGQFIECSFSVPIDRANAQGVGSGLTYVRRYSLCCVVGIAAQDDDDGNAASSKTTNQGQQKQGMSKPAQVQKTEEKIDIYVGNNAQKTWLGKSCKELGITEKEVMLSIHEQALKKPLGEVVILMKMYAKKRKEHLNDQGNTEAGDKGNNQGVSIGGDSGNGAINTGHIGEGFSES